RHTRSTRDWSSDVCSSDLVRPLAELVAMAVPVVPWCLRSQLAGAGVDLPGNKERGQIPHDVAERRAPVDQEVLVGAVRVPLAVRSEERRVGNECRARLWGE